MKIKGITFAEQHVEKGVLGLAVLALVGIGAWQFLGPSPQVTVDGRTVAPGEVDQILVDRAEALNLRLRDEAPLANDPFPEELPLIADRFASILEGGVGRTDPLPRLQPMLANALVPADLGAAAWYVEPRFPAASILASVQQTDDAFTNDVIEAYPALAERFGDASAPRDVSFLTPSATIDPVAMREALQATDPTADPPRVAIPSLWYNHRLFILDVHCEREERLPNGQFGNRVLVSTLPGQTTLRPDLESNPDAAMRNRMLEVLSDQRIQRQILQPDFLPTRNSAFAPPSIDEEAETDQADTPGEVLRRELERVRTEVSRVRERLDELGGPLVEEGGTPGRPGRPDGGDRDRDRGRGSGGATAPGGGLGGGGLGGASRGDTGGDRGGQEAGGAADRATDRLRRSLGARLRDLEGRVGRVEAQLREVAPELLGDAEVTVTPFNLAGDDPIQIWAHDIDVQPGAVYRYRFVVRMYNPFFARKRQLVEEQGPLADEIAIDTMVSEWTSPVEVTPQVAFFVSRAAPGEGSLGLGSAQIEVFRLFEGRWRREVFAVGPGDRIGRVVEPARGREGEPTIDFTTEWFVVDIIDDPTGETRSDRTRPALVLLQRVGSSERFVIRAASQDQSDSKRQRLFRDYSVG